MGSHDLANGSVTPATILSYEASCMMPWYTESRSIVGSDAIHAYGVHVHDII